MSNPKSRTIPDAISIYIVMLLIYCADIFFLKSDLTVLGDAFYSRVLSLIVLTIFIWLNKESWDILGISKKKKKFQTGAIYGTLFTVVPMIIVMVVESLIYSFIYENAVSLRFSPPSLSHVHDLANLTPAIAVIIYIFTTFVGSVFKEFFFRGYMLKKIKSASDFKTANIIQALMYMSFTLPMLLRNLVNHYYDNTTASLGVFIFMFYIIHETLAGIKWGLLTRVTGSTYTAIVDHFLYVFLSNSIFITNRYVTWSFMLHNLAIQVLSTVMVLIYYKINMKKLEEKRAKEKAESNAKRKAHAEKRKEIDRNTLLDVNLEEIREISPEQFKGIVSEANDRNSHHHHHHHHSSEHTDRVNEEHSKHNDALIENIPTAEASKKANEYLEEKMSSSHHHHHHHHHRSDVSGKVESYTEGDAAKKTEAYSDSLSLERRTPKHPHPHDKMAQDSLLSNEELDKANSDKMGGYSEDAIDDFLKNFSENMSAPHHHRHHSESRANSSEVTENVPENFNADSFLEGYSQGGSSSDSHHHSSHHHHHHHYRSEDEVVSMSEVSTDEFFDEYQKNVEDNKSKKKQGFIKKVRELGLVDDSDSNDLI